MYNIGLIIFIFILRIKGLTADCILDNIACRKTTKQSSTFNAFQNGEAGKAVDGYFGQESWSHTDTGDLNPWLMVDLVYPYFLREVILIGRNTAADRLDYFIVGYSNTNDTPVRGLYPLCGQWSGKALLSYNMTVYCSYQLQPARYIIVQQELGGPGYLTISELQAFGTVSTLTFSCPVGLYGSGCKDNCHCLNGLPCNYDGLCEAGCQQDWSSHHCHILTIESSTSYTSIGCYYDSNNLTKIQKNSNDLTTIECVSHCLNLGFVFAATYNGVECHCGNQTGKDWESQTDISNCAIDCKGNPTKKCGGINNYKNVYGEILTKSDGNCVLKNNDGNNIIGSCKKSIGSEKSNWLLPTCSIRDCAANKPCNINGICKYLNVSNIWYCECKTGFKLMEENCADIDECTNPNACDSVAENCNNTIGSYICTCKIGYVRSKCQDIDECFLNQTNCFQNETCSNTIGSYFCKLIEGPSEETNQQWRLIVGLVVGLIFLFAALALIAFLIYKFRNTIFTRQVDKNLTTISNTNNIDNDNRIKDSVIYDNPASDYLNSSSIRSTDDPKVIATQNDDNKIKVIYSSVQKSGKNQNTD